MRFKSAAVGGVRVFAVSGINTVSFGIEASAAARKGLLGFGVEREDLDENEKYPMYGFKVFESVIPSPDKDTQVSTFDHPVQSFVWDDFTAKEGHRYRYWFHPLKGTPRNLDRSARPVPIEVRTEPLFGETHDVFFNRGVASSQAYSRRFNNLKPDKQPTKEKRLEALEWLSRKLDEALLKFIGKARKGDALLCCFYEFRYEPVALELKAAIRRGVDVQLVLDGKINETIDKNGRKHESFPRVENRRMVEETGLPAKRVHWREAKPNDIQHNKFMVLLKGASRVPREVWTGSTNLSEGGIHGQTNVGHWVRDEAVARKFEAYWRIMQQDLGGKKGDDAATTRKKNAALKKAVESISAVPASVAAIPKGTSCLFSPRTGLDALSLYFELIDSAPRVGCITLAFGVNKDFKSILADNNSSSALTLMLLEKEDKAGKQSAQPFVFIGARQNVYKAWGSYLKEPLYQWTKETNAKLLQLNVHVSYVHSKFLLHDPLGKDPIVVTGSANFSNASTNSNDENMIIIRGDKRVADIYFTEFNRLFAHYYFRSVTEATARRLHSDAAAARTAAAKAKESQFLAETANKWLAGYAAGKYKAKRLKVYTDLAL